MEAIRGMVLNWKASYSRDALFQGGSSFLVEEFAEEIQTYVYPYLRRLYETNYLNESEGQDFLDFCFREVEDLRNSLGEQGNL